MKMKLPKSTAELRDILKQRFLTGLIPVASVCLSSCCTILTGQRISAEDLKPFRPDGCTCVPDGTPSDPIRWQFICEEHDRAYWAGGTYRERLNADRKFRDAIHDKDNHFTAELYYIGVRLGGSPWFPTPWRWGFGRPYPAGYHDYPDPDPDPNPDS